MPRCTFLTIITKTHTLAYSLVCVFRCKSTYLRRTNAVPPIIYCTLILFFVSVLGFFCVQVWNTSYIYRLCFNLGTNRIICIFKCTYFKKHFIAVGAFIACCTLHINWFSDAHIFWTMCCAIYWDIWWLQWNCNWCTDQFPGDKISRRWVHICMMYNVKQYEE